MRCINCGRELNDGGYLCLENWLQWHHYSVFYELPVYCSKECFADDWMVTWTDQEELEFLEHQRQVVDE